MGSEAGKMAISFEREAESPAGQHSTLGPDQSLPFKKAVTAYSNCRTFSKIQLENYSLNSKLKEITKTKNLHYVI